jgi:hypothetical protein
LQISEKLYARGHPNVIARHLTTFEVTRDSWLTRRGDCVIAVLASKGLSELSSRFKALCRNDEARITVEFRAGRIVDSVEGRGSRMLPLNHPREMVARKSAHISDRTLMIQADRAACDIRRDLIAALKSPETVMEILMTVSV